MTPDDKEDIREVVELAIARSLRNGIGNVMDEKIRSHEWRCAANRSSWRYGLFWKACTLLAILGGIIVQALT